MAKIYISWDLIEDAINHLVEEIQKSEKVYENIYAIPRGGYILGVMLSHRLNIPMVLNENEFGKDTLVVDDISDTGKTLEGMELVDIATITSTPWTTTKPTYYYNMKTEKDDWIIYPWENQKTEEERDGTC